jgi:acetyl esterase/lipase
MTSSRLPGRLASLVCLLASAVPGLAGPKKGEPAPANQRYEVKTNRDITYYKADRDPDAYRHRLDVYRPKGDGPFPVLFFVHGGGWMAMSKDDVAGLLGYGTVARCLAERGLVVVVPNYRLSPAVKHPEHIKDVARAFAWTCKNIADYGGDLKQLFVGGHSAGGHLAALLITDETYLKAEGLSARDVRGVIGVSGVYRLEDFELHLSGMVPSGVVSAKMDVRPLALVFGDDPKAARDASPLTHVRPGLPPFLLLNAGWDYPPLRRMAKEFAAALKENSCAVEARKFAWRTHETLLFDIPRLRADREAVDAIAEFIEQHSRPAPKDARKEP